MSSKSQRKQAPETLSVDEIGERYPEQWILLRVTEFSERHEPVAGEVVAASQSHAAIWRRYGKLHAQSGGRPGPCYIFQAFPPLPPGTTWHDILEEAARRGPPRGVRW
jgi:hypothetical protein